MTFAYEAVLFDLYGTLIDDAGEPASGAHALLRGLAGVRWAIVTSCPRGLARSLLANGCLPEPEVLVASDDVLHNKPAPEGYLAAARRLGADPVRTLVVEDSAHGIAAGLAAGCDVAAILRGRAPDFARAASFVVERLELLELRADGAGVVLRYG